MLYLRCFVSSSVLFSSWLRRSTSNVAIPLLFSTVATNLFLELYLLLPLPCANRTTACAPKGIVKPPSRLSKIVTRRCFICCSVIMPASVLPISLLCIIYYIFRNLCEAAENVLDLEGWSVQQKS